MAEPRRVRYSPRFLRLVHLLTERGVEHTEAAHLAREALNELQHEPATDWELHTTERTGRTAQPRRVGMTL